MGTPLPLSPFIDPDNRFVLDEAKFMSDITHDDAPLFLRDPSDKFERGRTEQSGWTRPICEVLTMFTAERTMP